MLTRLILRLVVLAGIIWLVARVVPGIVVTGGFWTLIWIAVVFSIVNLLLGTLLRALSFPLILVTLGLFLIVINAALLGITAALLDDLSIDGFWSAALGGLLIAVFSWIAELVLPLRKKDRKEQKGR